MSVAGVPAEMVREIGLRLREVAVSEFDNAQQIATLEAMRGRWGLPGLQVRRLLDAAAGGKAIWKDLIEHGILDPVWGQDLHLNGLGGHNLRPFFHASRSFIQYGRVRGIIPVIR